jgi:hypothetical protein
MRAGGCRRPQCPASSLESSSGNLVGAWGCRFELDSSSGVVAAGELSKRPSSTEGYLRRTAGAKWNGARRDVRRRDFRAAFVFKPGSRDLSAGGGPTPDSGPAGHARPCASHPRSDASSGGGAGGVCGPRTAQPGWLDAGSARTRPPRPLRKWRHSVVRLHVRARDVSGSELGPKVLDQFEAYFRLLVEVGNERMNLTAFRSERSVTQPSTGCSLKPLVAAPSIELGTGERGRRRVRRLALPAYSASSSSGLAGRLVLS